MSIYKPKIIHQIKFTIIIFLVEFIAITFLPIGLLATIVIYPLFTIFSLQIFFSRKLKVNSEGIHAQFKMLNKIQQETFHWKDLGRVDYRGRKVYLYNKQNEKIISFGNNLNSYPKLLTEIDKYIYLYNKDCILEGSFVEAVSKIN